MPARDARATFDWLVVTTANRRQARSVRMQLAARAKRGALPEGCRTLVVPDARDARIGSGAATVLALAAVLRSARGGIGGTRVLVLHSGGDSRRLPAYAAEGKLFASLPMPSPGMRCGTVFDLLLDDLLALPARPGGEVLVAAGDCVIGLRGHPVELTGPGIVGVAQRAPAARAMRHGVYTADAHANVRAFLQKPDLGTLRAARALDPRGRALVDTGLVSFDHAAAAALLAGAGVVQGRTGRVLFRPGSLADGASRAKLPHVDLYRELMCALPAAMTRAAFLRMLPPALRPALAPVHAAMRGTRFACAITGAGEFLHVGSTREMLDAVSGTRAHVTRFGLRAQSEPALGGGSRDLGRAVILDSRVGSLRLARGRAVVDRSEIGRASLGGENLLVGIRASSLRLPGGLCAFTVPMRDGTRTAVACGLDDDFKTPLASGGTLLGRRIADALRPAGAAADALVQGTHGDGTLWDVPLWPACSGADGLGAIRWMWEGARPPRAWLDAPRRSMRMVVADADLDRLAAERDAIERTSAAAATPAVLARVQDSLARARIAARAASASGTGTRARTTLRTVAFRAVGEAVMERFTLPSHPARAAILHDQAVWASSPVRMDLAGGWSDTPPICNEVGGAVVNMAISLRGQLPVQVMAKLDEEPVLRITSTDLGQTRVIRSARDLARRGDPTHWAAIAESALVLTGLAPADPRASLSQWLRHVGGGITLTLFSAVPKGSGLGTSSILGAAVIRALDRVVGRERTPSDLVAATSALEQMLSTRGGWQDQVGGALGGFKFASTAPGGVQHPQVQPIAVPAAALRELRSRSVLCFTGQRRMAKGILENVVWNWLSLRADARSAVAALHANAERMRGALTSGDVDAAVQELGTYRELKRRMDPSSCSPLLESLADRWRRHVADWCFAGAGGGGFVLLVAHDARHAASIRAGIEHHRPHPCARAFDLEVDETGLRCAVL